MAGLLVDKFAYHLPLYRQHQRLQDSGIDVSRPWLTQLSQRSISLLEPIYEAQFDSIRASRVKAMDETPIKAGRKERGKMKIGYFWPVYGEHNEVCFPFLPLTRGTERGACARNRACAGLGHFDRWLRCLCELCEEGGYRACAVLESFTPRVC